MSADAFRAAAPETEARIERASADFRGLSAGLAGYRFDWDSLITEAQPKMQAALMEDVHAVCRQSLQTDL